MTRSTIRTWYLIHKWSSLICTAFLLMLCVTGLPLIFHDEIDTAMGGDAESALAGAPSAETGLPLDTMLAGALAERPGEVPLFMAFSQDSPLLTVTTGPAPDAPGSEMTLLFFDRASGASLGPAPGNWLMDFLLQLHTDMFLGQPGMWVLGAMGLLSVLALAWMLVIGLTGAINAFADPLIEGWRDGEVAAMTAAYAGDAPLPPERYGSLDTAMAAAQAALPGKSPQFIGFPGGEWSSGHHYAIFFQGDRPVTQHLLTPALVDAASGELTDARSMPALNQALMISKPLHFGDYGGLPLKLVWTLLTLATIWVLWTGLLLWFRRSPGAIERRIEEIRTGARSKAAA